MREWIDPPAIEVPESLQAAVGGHPLVAQTLARRGFTELAAARGFLDPGHYQPTPPFDLPNLDRAVERLEEAIRRAETQAIDFFLELLIIPPRRETKWQRLTVYSRK